MKKAGIITRAVTTIALILAGAAATAGTITQAKYTDPTTRYDHGILGDAIEWGALSLTVVSCVGCADNKQRQLTIRLPENRVFEDFTPRLVAVTGSTDPAVMVVETDLKLGARLALYGEVGLIAATPFIGRTHRWLAPIGAADLDGDGQIEYAYVDRPHLARTIRVWRLINGKMELVDQVSGFTNHSIGDDYISGGVRDCGQGPEMIVTDSNWQNVVAVTYDGDDFSARYLGKHKNRRSFDRALNCKN